MKYLLLFFILVQSTAYADIITIAFMADYAPVSFTSPKDGSAIGIEPDIIREAFSGEKDVELKFIPLSWERVQDRVKKGKADAFISTVTPERLNYATHGKVPVFYDSYTFFTYAGHPDIKKMKKIKGLNDIKDYKFCEYSGSGWAKNNLVGKVKSIDFGNSIDMKISMLAARRCDLILDINFLVTSTAKRLNISDSLVKIPVPVIKGTEYHLLIGKNSPYKKKLKSINYKLQEMHNSGRVQQIVQKWTEGQDILKK